MRRQAPPRTPPPRSAAAAKQRTRWRVQTRKPVHRTYSPWAAGPGRTPNGRAAGGGRAPESGHPWQSHKVPSLGALLPPQQCATPARKSARCGVPHGPPQQQPRAQRRRTVGPGCMLKGGTVREGECSNPDTPHGNRRRTRQSPSWHPHSKQHHLARACAVGSMTGPHTYSPRAQGTRAAGPGCTSKDGRLG